MFVFLCSFALIFIKAKMKKETPKVLPTDKWVKMMWYMYIQWNIIQS